MNNDELQQLARQMLQGEISPEAFLSTVTNPKSIELGEATLDSDRRRRCGFPEVVYGEGKPAPVLSRIIRAISDSGEPVLATRVSEEKGAVLLKEFPQGRYNETARTFRTPGNEGQWSAHATSGLVAVVTAGTSDLPVSREALETLDWMGVRTEEINDVGVAGPHRLPESLDRLCAADAVVVVAGMEGALPSIVGGFVDCPVVGVPTSVGYGANFGGLSALLAMLNSCASNVVVVNIDAGFKGAYVAGMIARKASEGE